MFHVCERLVYAYKLLRLGKQKSIINFIIVILLNRIRTYRGEKYYAF